MFDSLFHGGSDAGIALVIAVLAYFFKKQLKIYDKHIETCDQVPKSLIMTKLDNVCERVDDMHTAIATMAQAQTALTQQVAILVGRQQERDAR